MRKVLKSRIFLCIITTIIVSSLSVYAATLITADQVSYKDKALDEAIDVLYDRSSNLTKFCKLIEGTFGEVGSKYECDPGDGVKRNFYLLANNSDNSVELIMERNITEGSSKTTMILYDAMDYIDSNNLRTLWKNVMDVNLPAAQDIANAVGRSDWKAVKNNEWWCFETKKQDTTSDPYCYNNTTNTLWLWDYTRECSSWKCEHSLSSSEANGYWTRDLISNTTHAWYVAKNGSLRKGAVSDSINIGVRLVITVLKSNLYQ